MGFSEVQHEYLNNDDALSLWRFAFRVVRREKKQINKTARDFA